MATAKVTDWRVVEGTQVHHDGVTYAGGETFKATEAEAAFFVQAGWVEPAK